MAGLGIPGYPRARGRAISRFCVSGLGRMIRAYHGSPAPHLSVAKGQRRHPGGTIVQVLLTSPTTHCAESGVRFVHRSSINGLGTLHPVRGVNGLNRSKGFVQSRFRNRRRPRRSQHNAKRRPSSAHTWNRLAIACCNNCKTIMRPDALQRAATQARTLRPNPVEIGLDTDKIRLRSDRIRSDRIRSNRIG